MAAAIVTVIALGLRYLEVGRQLLAIGSNPDGSSLIGVPVTKRILAAFGFAGLLAGFDGALWASRLGTVDSQVAVGVELTVIASVVVGGVAIRGGSWTVLGVLLGTITLLVINIGESILGTSRGPQDAVKIVERLCELNIKVYL